MHSQHPIIFFYSKSLFSFLFRPSSNLGDVVVATSFFPFVFPILLCQRSNSQLRIARFTEVQHIFCWEIQTVQHVDHCYYT